MIQWFAVERLHSASFRFWPRLQQTLRKPRCSPLSASNLLACNWRRRAHRRAAFHVHEGWSEGEGQPVREWEGYTVFPVEEEASPSWKKPSPRSLGRGRLGTERLLVVVVNLGGCRVVEFARGANRLLTRIGPRKPGGLVPVEMVDSVRVFGVGLGQFAGEDLRLLLEPTRPQGFDRGAVRWSRLRSR